MALLVYMGSKKLDIPGLAHNKLLAELSQKRITKAVRETLRKQYGFPNVKVSCTATIVHGSIWTGKCTINGIETPYRLMAGLYS